MGVNMVNRKIHLFALPINNTYVLTTEKFRTHIKDEVKKKGGNLLLDHLQIERRHFSRFIKGKKCSLYLLFKIYNNIGIDIEFLEKNVTKIVSGKNGSLGIENPKLPFLLDNKYGGTLLGGVMGDGSLGKSGHFIYGNKSKILINNILNAAKNIFGDVDYGIYTRDYEQYDFIQINLPIVIGDVAYLLGVKRSYKILSDCYIELSEFSDEFNIHFIKQFFDDEGNVRRKDRRLQVKQVRKLNEFSKEKIRENPYSFAPKILLQIKNSLNRFGIQSTISLEYIRHHGGMIKGDFALNIYGKENLENFEKIINFNLVYKRNLLREVIKSYKFPSAPRNGRLQFAISKARTVENNHGHITKHLLAKECKRSLKTATYFLVDMKKKGLVKVVEEPRTELGHPLPKKYSLIQ